MDVNFGGAYWYALHVRSRREKVVYTQLCAKQCDAFLPLYRARHKWVDRYKTVSLPLFPGYVFCRFTGPERSSVLATSGVIEVVQMGAIPAPIAESEIEAIRLAVEARLAVEPYEDLITGQEVTMQDGPLIGLRGKLVSVRKDLRLVLSVELLHRSVAVEIERDWVDGVAAPPPASGYPASGHSASRYPASRYPASRYMDNGAASQRVSAGSHMTV